MNKRNWLASFLIGAIAITSFQSCKSDDETTPGGDTGPTEWTRSTVFPEDPRNGAASFVLDGEGYVVGGYNNHNHTVFSDVWSFDGNQWTPRAAFPGAARHSSVGFSVGDKGFVGTGYSNDTEEALNDFYSFDPATGWTEIAPLPGDEPRFGAVAFALDGYGYVGLGRTPSGKTFSDFYKYDPVADSWELITPPFSYKKDNAFAFVIGDKAYVGGGWSNNQLPEDFYSFDGTTWTPLRDLTRQDSDHTYDVRRHSAGAFSIGNYGYVVSGRGLTGVVANVWKYDPATDTWTGEHQALQGTAREKAVAFALGGRGYITTGSNGSTFLDDNWVFAPVR